MLNSSLPSWLFRQHKFDANTPSERFTWIVHFSLRFLLPPLLSHWYFVPCYSIISPAMPVANEQQISLFYIRYTDIITIVLRLPASGNVWYWYLHLHERFCSTNQQQLLWITADQSGASLRLRARDRWGGGGKPPIPGQPGLSSWNRG